jgi:hypothetical protein
MQPDAGGLGCGDRSPRGSAGPGDILQKAGGEAGLDWRTATETKRMDYSWDAGKRTTGVNECAKKRDGGPDVTWAWWVGKGVEFDCSGLPEHGRGAIGRRPWPR